MPGPGSLSAFITFISGGTQNLGSLARLAKVRGALLDNIDSGIQPIPYKLAVRLASFLGVDVDTLLSFCVSLIDSDRPIDYTPRIPLYLDGVSRLNVAALGKVQQPTPLNPIHLVSTIYSGAGDLRASSGRTDGTGTNTPPMYAGSGDLLAQSGLLTGSGIFIPVRLGSGDLLAQSGLLSGDGVFLPLRTGSGALVSQSGLLSGTATAFSPLEILGSDLVAWYDAEDVSTLFQDLAATTPSSNGSPVAVWKDRSSYGYHLTSPGGASNRPTRTDGGLSGLRALYFDGGDFLHTNPTTLAAFNGTSKYELWIRTRTVTPNPGTAVIAELSQNSAGLVGAFMHYQPSGTSWQHLLKGNVGISSRNKTGLDTVDHVIRCTADMTLSTNEALLFIDASSAGTTQPSNANNTGTMGNYIFNVGARFGPSNLFTGYVRSILLVRRLLTAGEVTQITTYMTS